MQQTVQTNAKTMKEKLEQAEACIAKWRKRLRIDEKWSIKCIMAPQEEEGAWAMADLNKAEYWRVEILLQPRLLDSEVFDSDLERAIIHELLHVCNWQIMSYCQNVIGSEKLNRELLKLEEQFVAHLEEVIYQLVRHEEVSRS